MKRFRNASTGEYVSEEYAAANPDTTVSETDQDYRVGWAVIHNDLHGVFDIEIFSNEEAAITMGMKFEAPVRKIKFSFID